MKTLATVTPLLWEESLIIALHSDWIKVFNNQIPTFAAQLDDDGHLCIISKETVRK